MMASALIVLYASRELGLPAGTIGLAFGIGAVGGLLGAVAATPLSRILGAGRLVAAGAIVFPGGIAIAVLADGPLWARAATLAAAEFVMAFAVMCFDIPLNAIQAAVIDDSLRSRVYGAFSSINYGSQAARRGRRRVPRHLDRCPRDHPHLRNRRPVRRTVADPLTDSQYSHPRRSW